MLRLILEAIPLLARLANKLLPSWEWKGGRAERDAEINEEALDSAHRTAEIRRDTRSLSDDALDRELRKHARD